MLAPIYLFCYLYVSHLLLYLLITSQCLHQECLLLQLEQQASSLVVCEALICL